jgi:hypothetical protein
MQKLTDSKYLLLNFNLLIKAAEEYKNDDFEGWIRLKSIFNLRLNRLSSKYFSKKNFDSAQKLNRLLSLSLLLRSQYMIRTKIFFGFQKIKSKKLKVLLCFISIYLKVFQSLIKSFLSLAFLYDCAAKREDNKKIIITIGFPSHAFNYHSESSSSNISSFGEYLRELVCKDSKIRIVSINEYIRNSKKNEKHVIDDKLTATILQNNRYFAKRKFSVSFFISNFFKVIYLWRSQYKKFSIISLAEYASEIRLIPYLDLIAKISPRNQVAMIFIMPFTELEFFRNHKSIKDKVHVFYYSENFLVPPARQSKSPNHEFADLNISALGGYCKVFGLTGNMNYLYDFVEYSFAIERKNLPTMNEFPCIIGYESLFRPEFENEKFTIALFDVPAESLEVQLARSIIGDRTADLDFITEFLEDFIYLSEVWNFKVLFKLKYSLSNVIYDDNYKIVIDRLISKLGANLEIVDPYARLADIVNNSDLVISFPYTSTQKFSKLLGKKSYFYIPNKYMTFFLNDGYRSDCLYGLDEMQKILVSLCGQQRG